MQFDFIKRNGLLSAATIVLCTVVLLYFLYNVWGVITSILPIEFREGHSLSSTLLLLKGQNPFDISSYPQYYNSYGILYNILMIPFVWFFGKSLIVFRIVNELFWIATVLFLVFFKSKSINSWKAVVIVATYILFHYNTNMSIRPDGLGTFLFVLSLVIPYRNRFSDKSVIITLCLSIFAFYTKPYFILSWYIVSLAYIFIDWKKCLIYNIFFHVIFFITAFITVKIFPLYFYETIFAYSGEIDGAVKLDYNGLRYSWLQLKWTFKDSLPLLLLCAPIVWNIKNKSLWPLLIFVFATTVVLIYPLGTNFGATQTYHSQLLIPILALLALELPPFVKYNNCFAMIASFLLLYTIYRMPFYRSENTNEWNKIISYTENSQRVLNSPIVAPLLLLDDKDVTDDGVSGFVFGFKPREITSFLFGYDSLLLSEKHKYIKEINENIKNQYYDCVILTSGTSVIPDVNATYYHKIDSFDISLPLNHSFGVNIYLPLKSSIENDVLDEDDFIIGEKL